MIQSCALHCRSINQFNGSPQQQSVSLIKELMLFCVQDLENNQFEWVARELNLHATATGPECTALFATSVHSFICCMKIYINLSTC